jgi:hypothetical protein
LRRTALAGTGRDGGAGTSKAMAQQGQRAGRPARLSSTDTGRRQPGQTTTKLIGGFLVREGEILADTSLVITLIFGTKGSQEKSGRDG